MIGLSRRFLALGLLVAGCAGGSTDRSSESAGSPWPSRAVTAARGEITVLPDGRRQAVRYAGWDTRDFGRFRTYRYGDTTPEIPVTRGSPPAGVTGDAAKGRALFLARSKGPCTGCHLIPGADVWPAGSVGPDLSTLGERRLPTAYLYQQIYDPRVTLPNTAMPPWGAAGVFSAEEIVHLVAFLQSLTGPPPPERDPERDPRTRQLPVGFGDNLDPTNNPAVLLAEGAEGLWSTNGPSGRACADCHRGTPEVAMGGVAVRYPKYVKAYRRVMSLDDFLTVHGPERTGRPLLAESADNLNLTMLIKMASNGLPVEVDVTSPEARSALARGRDTFYRRVGERNHACADCHAPDRGASKFLGGRLLGDVTAGLTRHFPTWRTNLGEVWDLRKRFQWCMTPLGTNMLPADAVEYAELELYLTSFDNGKAMSVPGIRH